MSDAVETAVVDAGVLRASIDRTDWSHEPCRTVLARLDRRLYIPALVAAEVLHFVGKRLGSEVEARFLASLGDQIVEAPRPDDWSRIAQLVQTYSDFPLGGVDASVVVLAERPNTDLVVTLDRRHFAAIRPRHVPAFRLLPD